MSDSSYIVTHSEPVVRYDGPAVPNPCCACPEPPPAEFPTAIICCECPRAAPAFFFPGAVGLVIGLILLWWFTWRKDVPS